MCVKSSRYKKNEKQTRDTSLNGGKVNWKEN
jgi:hypothetical protein